MLFYQCFFGLPVGALGALGGPGRHGLAVGQLEILKYMEVFFILAPPGIGGPGQIFNTKGGGVIRGCYLEFQ